MEKRLFLGALTGLALGLAVGGAGGYLLSPGAAPAAAPTSAADRGSSPPGGPPPPGTAATPPAGAPTAGAARSAPAGPAAAPQGTGDGTITGKVVGPSGDPLAGVLVRAAPIHDWFDPEALDPDLPPGSPPPRPDVDSLVREYEAALRRGEESHREASTDATGTYLLEGLASGTYHVQAWLAGYRFERTRGSEWVSVPVGRTCDFRGKPMRSVRVSVLLPDGSPPRSATVSWKAVEGDEEQSAPWRPEDPDIPVDCGTFEFTASANAFQDAEDGEGSPAIVGRRWRRWDGEGGTAYRSEPRTATVATEGTSALEFRLRGQPGILVKVEYASADHPTAARIAAVPMEDGKVPEPSRLLGEEGVVSTWVDESGRGLLGDLEPGTYLVGVTFRGGATGPTTTVVVGDDLATQEFRIPGEVRDWIRVWVRGPDGAAVDDAEIECGCRGSEGNGTGEVEVAPEPDGSYRVEHFEMQAPHLGGGSFSGEELGPGPRTYFVRATSLRFGTGEAIYDPARDREVTVAFAAPAFLRVTLAGWADHPDRDRASLSLEEKPEEGRDRANDLQAGFDLTGTARFGPLNPGKYEVALCLSGIDRSSRGSRRLRHYGGTVVSRVPIALKSGETPLTIPFLSLSSLTVTFEGDAPNLQQLGADGAPEWRRGGGQVEKEKGSITFEDLAPGRYRLVGRTGDMWVDVPAPMPVAFAPSPFNAYFLQVLDQGYLRDLGLRTGDLVVAVDGFEFKDRFTMDVALLASKARESSTFTILREGQRFDVTAEGRRVEEDEGSYYQPWSR